LGTVRGVGRIYQQTFIDTYCKVAFAKLYTEKTPITVADLLNDRVLPFSAEHEVPAESGPHRSRDGVLRRTGPRICWQLLVSGEHQSERRRVIIS